MNYKDEKMNHSPENKKINYYEQNPKLLKKQRPRDSLDRYPRINNENIFNNENIKLNFDDNISNQGIINKQNNYSISQPVNTSNIPKNNNFGMNNILDDILDELEDEDKGQNSNYSSNKNLMASELNGLFQRNKYNAYFQTSRTQNPNFLNVWEDFHQKRDKL